MSILSRLFGPRPDDCARVRPLWQRIVAIAREPRWYAHGGVADTVSGRFDMVVTILSLALLRMERDPTLADQTARLTELFVADMDGQLREAGIGDPSLGKRMGKLMEALGGRLGGLREALAAADPGALEAAMQRNLTFRDDGGDPAAVAADARQLYDRLCALDSRPFLAGDFAR